MARVEVQGQRLSTASRLGRNVICLRSVYLLSEYIDETSKQSAAKKQIMDSNRPDDLDRHLLSLLQANAREPVASLARKLQVARTTIVARIARLEREGVVAGYGVRLGRKPETDSVRAFCGLSVNAKSGSAVMKAVERMPEVEEVWAVSGRVDYMVLLRCDTPEKLDLVLDRLGQIDGVNQTQSSIVLSRKLDRRSNL